MLKIKNKIFKKIISLVLGVIMLFYGLPSAQLVNYVIREIKDQNVVDLLYQSQKSSKVIDNNIANLLKPGIGKVKAANFQMQTGYYMGSGAATSISGVGFQPDFILIKSNTSAGQAVFKTSAMAAASMSYMGATADITTSQLTIASDGFSLGTNVNVNSVNVRYVWTAFAGSDCTETGTFCVGQYTGNNSSPRLIQTGFQPSLVIVKRTTAIAGHFQTASMDANNIRYLANTVTNTTGYFIRDLQSNGFNVGHSGTTGDNVSGGVYNYIAFKTVPGVFNQGSYIGNATDNRDITGVGFQPSLVLVKNGTNVTANNTRPLINLNESYGDNASHFSVTANTVNVIQQLQSDGFQVGTSVFSNGTGDTYYWFAFGGAPNYPAASGNYEMDVGTYTGTGGSLNITGLTFAPDLILLKGNNANQIVFRTKLMNGDITAYLGSATTDFAGGITSLNSDGFTVGTSLITNNIGTVYHWQAFGNAYNPQTNSGSSDFAIGVYYGNGLDNRNITRLPWQPDFIAMKRNNSTVGVWKTSQIAGDGAVGFNALAQTLNYVQLFNSDGFQIGTDLTTNSSGSLYRWFAFKNSVNFMVGTYTGDASDNRDITDVGFQPELVWIKRSTAVNGVYRPSTLTDDNTHYFINVANVADRIQSLLSNGFQIGGNQTETNTLSGTYYYVAWKRPTVTPVISISITDDGLVDYGTLTSGQSVNTVTLADSQTIQNDSNIAVNLNIKTSAPVGWFLGSVAATNTFVHEFSSNAGSSWTNFIAVDQYQTFYSGLQTSSSVDLDLRFTAPEPSTLSATEKTITTTIQAVEP